MNERIKELAIEARLISPEYSDCTHTTLSPQEQKFAELIVRECMNIANRTRDNFGSANPDVLEGGRGGAFCVYHNIKNTFGVES